MSTNHLESGEVFDTFATADCKEEIWKLLLSLAEFFMKDGSTTI